MHLNVVLGLDIAREILALHRAQALVPFLIRLLELHIRWGPRPQENGQPVPEDIALSEGPMAVSFRKLVRVQIFSGGLAPTDQEEMVSP